MSTEAKRRANKKWNDANMKIRYDRIGFFVPAGNHEVIKKAAASAGVSVNSFIQMAILEKMKLTEWPEKSSPNTKNEGIDYASEENADRKEG